MKWPLLKKNVRGAESAANKSTRKWLLFAGAIFVTTFTAFLLTSKPASADVGNNSLLLVGKYCHDIDEITGDRPGGRCHNGDNDTDGWQEILNDSLGCSSSMFYEHANRTDPNDSSVTETLWYTKQAEYKDCWEKAQAMYNAMTSPSGDCHITKDGSDNHDKCNGYQDALHKALGCDDNMFQSANSNGNPNPNGDYWIIKPGASEDCKNRIAAVGNIHIRIIGPDGRPMNSPDPISSDKVKDTAGAAGAGDDDNTLGCDGSSNPLTWIICPIINDLLVPAITATDNLITQEMVIPAQNIFCTGNQTCAAYYTAWASFRNIALGLLVIAGLIVVISQAIGLEILDAYTIRKMLPRILIAAVGITLSWTLMNFAVTLSNNLGFGIRDLIVAPFHGLSSTINLDFSNSSILNSFFGAAAGLAAVPIWIAAGGIGVLLSYVATAGLAVLVAILVLILRQVAIIMLILISPIALIAYVLPNTQRIFRLWWESFSRALLMFPLIAAFIAAGRVFAAISLTDTSTAGIGTIIHGLIGFVAYFGPYFMIPLTFGMSGAMMSGIGNLINSRAQGVQGLLSNYRKGQAQQRIERARKEGLYREGFGKFRNPLTGRSTSVGHKLNTLGFWGLNADEMIPMKLGTTKLGNMIDKKEGIPGFRRGGQALHSQIKRARRDQTVKAAQDLDIGYKSGRLMSGQFQYYYDSLDAKHQAELDSNFGIKDPETGKFVGWRAPENWGERNQVAGIFNTAKGAGGTEAREAANELTATASEFEKYTASPETNRVDGRLLGLISAARAGRLEMEDVADNHNRWLEGGDQETAVRETTILQDALTPKRVSAARGHGIYWEEDGKAHSSYEDPASAKAQTSLMRINTQEIAAGKSEDVDALRESLVAGASGFKMRYDKGLKRVVPEIATKGPGKGRPVIKDPNSEEGRRVKEIRGRIKQLALYNYGDSDVGAKIRDIWVNRLGLDESELEWGRGGASAEDALIASHAGGPDAKPEPPPEAT